MTIWILAILLLAGVAAVGYNQGAVRAAMSFIGLIISALLAMPLSPLIAPAVRPLLSAFSIKNPVIIWAVCPAVVFIVLLTIFKVAGFAIHKQVEVFYKYKAGDLRLSLWERMNKRLGACMGAANALVYIVIIAVVINVIGYWTTQMQQGEGDSRSIRLFSRLAKDLQSTGLNKVAYALDPMKEDYYLTADIAGIVLHNPLATSRLSRYPALVMLSERQEFRDMSSDTAFNEMLLRQPPVNELLANEKIQAVTGNPELMNEIWGMLKPDLKDLHEFMLTGQTAKYGSEPLLGRWNYDGAGTYAELKKTRPNLSIPALKAQRMLLTYAYGKSSFIATPPPSKQAVLKDVIWVAPPFKGLDPNAAPASRAGEWQGDSSGYTLNLTDTKEMTATIEGNKLKISGEWTPLIFVKEE